MLAVVRGFASRVRRRRPFELVLVALLGFAGMAMAGTSSRAYTPLSHSAPLHRPVDETGRVARIVVAQAALRREARPLAPSTPRVPPLPRATPPELPARPPAHPPVLTDRVRGPPQHRA